MADDDLGDGNEPSRRGRDTLRALARSRPFRVLAAATAGAVVLMALSACWVYAQVMPIPCEPLANSDLSIDEMIAIKRRVEQHQPDSSGPLTLSGREASFLLWDNLEIPVRIAVEGTEVEAELSLPQEGTKRCYQVDYRGQVAVEAGVARLIPSHIAVGELDLSDWLAGTQLVLEQEDLHNERARALLSRTRHLEVVGGQLLVQIDDIRSIR